MEPRRVSPLTIALLILGFLVLRAGLFATTAASEFVLYKRYADAARTTSLYALYRDADVEYPPLAILAGVPVAYLGDALPKGAERLTAWRPSSAPDAERARFEVAMGLAVFAVDVACLALVYVVARRAYPNESRLARIVRLVLYAAATAAGGRILYDRQDLVVGLFALLALAAFARGWPVAAYALLTAGTAYKLVPVLLLPVFVLAAAAARSAPGATPRRFLLAVVWEAIVAGAVLAVYPVVSYLLWGPRSFMFLAFHSERGLQLEAASAWLAFLFDPDTRVGYWYSCMSMRGVLADRFAAASTPAVVLAAGLSVLVAARGFWRMARAAEAPPRNALVTHLAAASLLMWVGFILFTKVGSPQYLLWVAALVPLLPLSGVGRWCIAAILAATVVTTLIYPCYYWYVTGDGATDTTTSSGPNAFGLALLTAKSLLLVVSFLLAVATVWRGPPQSPAEVR